MSSNKKINECDCGGCRSNPTFKVSSCPLGPSQGEPESPVYGSLFNNGGVPATALTNVDFTEEGPFSGVTLNTTDNSITVNSRGIYNISFTTVVAIDGTYPPLRQISFFITINENAETITLVGISDESSVVESTTLSRTHQLALNQGDVIRVRINAASANVRYVRPELVVTKVV